MTQANLFIRFAAYHSYYVDGICRCIHFKPGSITDTLSKRFGFLIQNTVNGFEFYNTSKSNPEHLLQYILKTTGHSFFDFAFEAIDYQFYHISAIPPDWRGQWTYDSSNTVEEPNDNKIFLQENLSENKTTTNTGYMQIHFKDLISLSQTNSVIEYHIRFKAKATQWQYYIINKNAISMDNLFIKSDSEVEFEGPITVTIPSGQQALLFNSGKHLLPLCDKPGYKFSLVNRVNKNEEEIPNSIKNKMILKTLPSPDPSKFDLTEIEGSKQFSSPMYVYI